MFSQISQFKTKAKFKHKTNWGWRVSAGSPALWCSTHMDSCWLDCCWLEENCWKLELDCCCVLEDSWMEDMELCCSELDCCLKLVAAEDCC